MYTLRKDVPGIILRQPVLNLHQIHHSISNISTFKRKLLAYYKQFYKLRHFQYGQVAIFGNIFNPLPTEDLSEIYCRILRRRFRGESYNLKREKLLGASGGCRGIVPLSEQELEIRLMNTLAFVFNATVDGGSNGGSERVLYENRLVTETTETMESKILATIMAMDGQFPNSIKYDLQYRWVDKVDEDITKLEQGGITKKSMKKYSESIEWIGLKQYQTNLMKFNENLKLCL